MAHKVIRSSQTAFLPVRFIMDGVVILHETIQEMHKEKKTGVTVKLDFEIEGNQGIW
jgi:hypothetical protein